MRYTNEFIKIDNKQVKQINKLTAKKEYNKGNKIYLNACNMRLDNCWSLPISLDNKSGVKFTTILNEYEYYNCCNERGRYANFFIEV